MRNRFKRIGRLQTKFLVVLLPPVIFCFLAYAIFFSVLTYRDRSQSINNKLHNYAEVQSAILAKSLWEMNFKVARAQLNSILLDHELSGVRVSESMTGAVIEIGNLPKKFDDDGYFLARTDIIYNSSTGARRVGKLWLAARKDIIFRPLLQFILRDTILILLLVTAIIVAAVAANKGIMVTPLNRFLESIRRAAEEKIRKPVDWQSGDELGDVIAAYNRLLETLNATEKSLKKSEERFRSLVDVSSDWIWEIDQDSVITYTSPKITDLLGYQPDEVIGRKIYDLVVPEQSVWARQVFSDILQSETTFRNLEMTIMHRDKSPIIIESSGVPVFDVEGKLTGYRGIDRDITEYKRVQEMIIQSEKMLSVGGLAAGMAHEINNPLAGIMQNAQLIQHRLLNPSKKNEEAARQLGITMETLQRYHEKRGIFRMVEAVNQAGQRAAKIVDNILSFSRKEKSSKAPALLSELLDRTVELAGSDYDIRKKQDFRQLEIVREYDADEGRVDCESSKIQQVFLNILKNGTEAMIEASSRNPGFILRSISADDTVTIEIEDNGPGMDEVTSKRIFEPFFTTKAVGVGTGLGLSVSYFIITEDHGGTIHVESVPGRGTKFVICLPVSQKTGRPT